MQAACSMSALPPLPDFPRLRALALCGRRPPQRVERFVMPASTNLHTTGLRATAVRHADGLAIQRALEFDPDQIWQTHTSPTAYLQAISETREPQYQHPRCRDTARRGFCLVPAIPPPHLSDGDSRRSRSRACDKYRVLPEAVFHSRAARSLVDCRTAQIGQGHCTAE